MRNVDSMYMIIMITSFLCHHVRAFTKLSYKRYPRRIHPSLSSSSSFSSTSHLLAISERDEEYLSQALECAKLGFGNTFPNPAVGCVIVQDDDDKVIGSGFHPRAGFGHAEVFALLEAAGHVPDGVQAAKSILLGETTTTTTISDEHPSVQDLMNKYISENGAKELFGNVFESVPVTAYVTLEPCSHFGRTPPCASSLALSKVNRVVVGFRDPNPRVDGGGVQFLQEAGVQVDMAEGTMNEKCAAIVKDFCKRITPKDYDDVEYSWMNGQKRSALRSLAGNKKREGTLEQVNWTGKEKASDEDGVDTLEIHHKWLERVDSLLWKEEIVNLRLNKACGKKKLAKRLGERIAKELGAHVTQCVGHTVLLYRPGVPPVLDLDELVQPTEVEEAEIQET